MTEEEVMKEKVRSKWGLQPISPHKDFPGSIVFLQVISSFPYFSYFPYPAWAVLSSEQTPQCDPDCVFGKEGRMPLLHID